MTTKNRKRLKAQNLKAIQKYLPPLVDVLKRHALASKLVFDKNGEADVLVNGAPFYNGRASALAAEQVEAFKKGGHVVVLPKPKPGTFDEHTNRFLQTLERRTAEEGIRFTQMPENPESHYLIVFGIGLGYHIDALLDASDAETVILVDQTLDFFCHSLEVYDWKKFFDSMTSRNRTLHFAFGESPKELSLKLCDLVVDSNPSSVDGTRVFIHGDEALAAQVLESFYDDAGMVLSYLGYFNDEIIMLRNVYNTLKSGNSKIYQRPKDRKIDVPVFLVASGPSLDESIPFIRDNADKAIIISNGSALRPLLVNGIVPDFHIEIENVFVYPLVSLAAEDFDLSKICLIASSTVDPHILEFFDDVIFFFRSSLSPYPLFCESERNCLLYSGPTVVNAGLSFAQEMRFQEIYFFGVDLGTRGTGLHHSKDTYHYSESAIPENKSYNIPQPGNFGGEVYSALDFAFTLMNMVAQISRFGGEAKYFNCSDGVFIKGTLPQMVDLLSFLEVMGGKKKIVDEIIDAFPVYTKTMFDKAWNKNRIIASINGFADRLVKPLNGPAAFQDRADLIQMTRFFRPKIGKEWLLKDRFDNMVRQLFRGTFLNLLSVAEFFAQRLSTPDRQPAFASIVQEEITACAERLRGLATEFLSDPTVVPMITNEGAIEADGVIPEVTASWGKVPRNAPCPCGSGKKYKKCHGAISVLSRG